MLNVTQGWITADNEHEHTVAHYHMRPICALPQNCKRREFGLRQRHTLTQAAKGIAVALF